MAYNLTMAFHKWGTLLVFGVTNSLHFNKEKVISPLNIGRDGGGRKETGWVHMQKNSKNEGQRNCEIFRI